MTTVRRIFRVALKIIGGALVLAAILNLTGGDWRNAIIYIVLAALILLM